MTILENANTLGTLACAYAANGRFADAVRTQRQALALEKSRKLKKRLKRLLNGETCFEI